MSEEADWLRDQEYDDFFGIGDENLEFPGEQVHETDKAVLWRRSDVAEPDFWIPKSQIVEKTDCCLTITAWLAEKRGLLPNHDTPDWYDTPDWDDEIPF